MGWTLAYPDIKPCPFCGRTPCDLKSRDFEYYVMCPQCHAEGPHLRLRREPDDSFGKAIALTETYAISKWNERM